MKYRCSKCKNIFEGQPDKCPFCGTTLKWNKPESEAKTNTPVTKKVVKPKGHGKLIAFLISTTVALGVGGAVLGITLGSKKPSESGQVEPAIFSDPIYSWNYDYSQCTATRMSTNYPDLKETEVSNSTYDVTKPATCTVAGEGKYTATFTNEHFETQYQIIVLPIVPHDYGAPIYTWDENNAHCTARRECSMDASHYEEETVSSTYSIISAATCLYAGLGHFEAHFTNTTLTTQTQADVIPALGHNFGTPTYSWNEEHTVCTARRECLRDSTHYEEEVSYASTNTNNPTCTTSGLYRAVATFTNFAFTTQIYEKAIDELGHDWLEPTYEWNMDTHVCHAQRICSRDSSHVENEYIFGVFETLIPSTCSVAGSGKYTASFTNTAFTTQVKEVSIPKLNHNYVVEGYEWNEDHSKCTATAVCANDSSHAYQEIREANYVISEAATCETNGVGTYTAHFTDPLFTDQIYNVSLPAIGHSFKSPVYSWDIDGLKCTARRVCSRDANHYEEEVANLTYDVLSEATCGTKGSIRYTATFTNPVFTTQTKDIETPKLDHVYGPVTYSWNSNYSQCTATRVCLNDENHYQSETKNSNSTNISDATCEEDGLRQKTVTFENTAFETQVEYVVVPALGHMWQEPTYFWNSDYSQCTARRTCARDTSHIEEEIVDSSLDYKAPTCSASGKSTYTASFTNPIFEEQTYYINHEKLPHEYGEPTYSWGIKYEDTRAHNNYYCTATRTCLNNSSHRTSETVTAEYQVLVEPTATTDGVIRHAASFADSVYSTQYVYDSLDMFDTGNGSTPIYDSTGKYCYFGIYPQNRVVEQTTIDVLETLTPERNGWYLLDGSYYAKVIASPSGVATNYYVEGETYWFKCNPIKWRVLTPSSTKKLLLSEYSLDRHIWNDRYDGKNSSGYYACNYYPSSLRSWLIGDFYNHAFIRNKSPITNTSLTNYATTNAVTKADKNCSDPVFILNYADLINTSYGFSTSATDSFAASQLTNYLWATGAYNEYNYASYWFRGYNTSSGIYNGVVSGTAKSGVAYVDVVCCVRPAITINV